MRTTPVTRNTRRLVWIFLFGFSLAGDLDQAAAGDAWWNQSVDQRLAEAGTNRVELVKALTGVSPARREGMAFLVENMPAADLQALSAEFLIENLDQAYDAWEKSPWQANVSKDLFLNDVLPYACLNERRDPWRAKLRTASEPIVSECKTPGEAAQRLNQRLFPLLKVRYNTGRKRPDASPRETIESGVATCTGLSILLVDACRSVGIPARVAGTPMWANLRGNHTWVEVWDSGWHFAGAAEPDAAGLDHAWFVHDAAEAKPESPQHSIYATSFRRTQVSFPLVWRPEDKSVNAVNVTERYLAKSGSSSPDSTVRLSIRVLNPAGKRVVADLLLNDLAHPATVFKGQSRGETGDLNNFESFQLAPGGRYHVSARLGGLSAEEDATIGIQADQIVTLRLEARTPAASEACLAPPPNSQPLTSRELAKLEKALGEYFALDGSHQAVWKFNATLERMLARDELSVRQVAWNAYAAAPIHAYEKAEFDAHVVKFGQYQSPYTVKRVGTRPAKGWALFIAMHGGGGAPKEVNDSQWKHMQIYYKDHPEAGGYLYLALRAPNDTWNGFYDDYVYPLIDNLVRQFRLFGDIDPDKVFIMGYSHGGYGAYAIGPKIPDHFAAIHASAAAATDGETTPKTLRTTPFSAMVGERDTMYGRYERNLRFKEEVEKLRGSRTDIYPVTVTVIPGNGHTGLPDRDLIVDLYPAVRNPVPRELDWLMTDTVVQDFFWLRVPKPAKQEEIAASCQNNRFVLRTEGNLTGATVFMDRRLVNFAKPVEIEINGSTTVHRFSPSLQTLCGTLARRGDPQLAFSAEFKLTKDELTGGLKPQP